MEIKRRDFLKITAAAGAVAAIGLPKLNAFAAGTGTASGSAPTSEWIPSTCQGCTAWCPVEFLVQEGRIVKVRGNQLSKAKRSNSKDGIRSEKSWRKPRPGWTQDDN